MLMAVITEQVTMIIDGGDAHGDSCDGVMVVMMGWDSESYLLAIISGGCWSWSQNSEGRGGLA